MLLILVISLQVGRLATLLKPADIVFISPRQAEMGQYLQKALQSSLIFAWVFDTLVMLALTPFLLVAAKLTVVQLIFLWLLLLVLKYLQLERKLLGLYQAQFASGRWKWFLDIGFCGLLLGTSLYLDPLYLLLVAALLTGYIDKSKKLSRHRLYSTGKWLLRLKMKECCSYIVSLRSLPMYLICKSQPNDGAI